MPRPTKFHESNSTELIKLYKSGASILMLASEFHIGQKRVRDILASAGVLRTQAESIEMGWTSGVRKKTEWRRRGADIIDGDLIRLHSIGLSPPAISSQLKVSSKRVQARMAELGLIPGIGRHECKICKQTVEGHAGREVCRVCVPEDFFTRWHKYGISKPEFDKMLESQGGHCGLCNEPATHLDHDHETLVNRGILCNTCNVAMAAVDRDIEWTARARAYKERNTK
jgi:hypothetical protein